MANKYEKLNEKTLALIKEGKLVPPLRLIRLKCLECVCWQANEVKRCHIDDCILHSFRMGKRPSNMKKKRSQKQLENDKRISGKK